jgi:hypothetical protein
LTGVQYVIILVDKESKNELSINSSESLNRLVDDLTRVYYKTSKRTRNVNIQCTLNDINDTPLHVPSYIDRNKNDKTISPSIPPAFSANTFGSEHSISELSVSLATVHRNRINYKTDKIHEVLNKVDINQTKKKKKKRSVRRKENDPF